MGFTPRLPFNLVFLVGIPALLLLVAGIVVVVVLVTRKSEDEEGGSGAGIVLIVLGILAGIVILLGCAGLLFFGFQANAPVRVPAAAIAEPAVAKEADESWQDTQPVPEETR